VVDPLISLTVLVVILIIAAFFFLPRYRNVDKRKKAKRNTIRVLIEDALKHFYDCEYKKLNCTLDSIAGNLSISGDDAAKLIARLESLGLIRSYENYYKLTYEGRSYALRVIRIHRLWEKYLADETGIQETDWHIKAELKEHILTSAEADKLAAELGNPLFDPHGDPIPSSSGELPYREGIPLNSLKQGEFAQIIHIEDEPPAVYAQLVAQRLYPGIHVRMIELSKERIVFEANGEECILAPVLASNITVSEIPAESRFIGKQKHQTLNSLQQGETGEVIGISKACRGQQRRRLMDLGVVPGSKITSEMKSISGDPIAFNIRGATIALRKQQAEQIFIKSLKEEEVLV